MKLSSNKVIAIILFVFSIGYLYMSFQIPTYILPRPVDSDLFPKVLGFTMLLLSVFLFFEKKKVTVIEEEVNEQLEEIMEEQQKELEEEEVVSKFRTPQIQVVVSIIGIILYILLFEKIGFILSTVLFSFFMTFYYGYKRHVVNGIVSVSVALSFYLLLTKALGVYLPIGWIPL